jgi:hypothetical protein
VLPLELLELLLSDASGAGGAVAGAFVVLVSELVPLEEVAPPCASRVLVPLCVVAPLGGLGATVVSLELLLLEPEVESVSLPPVPPWSQPASKAADAMITKSFFITWHIGSPNSLPK